MPAADSPSDAARVGPHPSYIEVAKPYIFQHKIDAALASIGMSDAKEDVVRLQGVGWIDNVRKELKLPVRTFNTAVVYFHKFRLLHHEREYSYADAAAAALFTACKIEDTLKKSREILCAAFNMTLAPSNHLSSDDPRFESHSKTIVGLERLMLESAGFDFRGRHPQELCLKLAKELKWEQKYGKTAWNLSMDMYRTFAPLKQTRFTMAYACVELAARLHELDTSRILSGEGPFNYSKACTSRAEIMETLLDLLQLYTHHRANTQVGPQWSLDTYLSLQIYLNEEATVAGLPRYTQTPTESKPANGAANPQNGAFDPTTPITPMTPGTISPSAGPTSAIGVRGQNGTVRFMLSAARAREEQAEVEKYTKVEEEEYEVEAPVKKRTRKRNRRKQKQRRNSQQKANAGDRSPQPQRTAYQQRVSSGSSSRGMQESSPPRMASRRRPRSPSPGGNPNFIPIKRMRGTFD